MDYTIPGILQARILEWVAFPPSLGDLPNPGIKPRSLAFQANFLPSEPPIGSEHFVIDKAPLLKLQKDTTKLEQTLWNARSKDKGFYGLGFSVNLWFQFMILPLFFSSAAHVFNWCHITLFCDLKCKHLNTLFWFKFKSCHLIFMWFWANCIIFVCLSFLVCKMKIIRVFTLYGKGLRIASSF